MRIEFTKEKSFIELLPSITVSWGVHTIKDKQFSLYIGWLFWNIVITNQEPYWWEK